MYNIQLYFFAFDFNIIKSKLYTKRTYCSLIYCNVYFDFPACVTDIDFDPKDKDPLLPRSGVCNFITEQDFFKIHFFL